MSDEDPLLQLLATQTSADMLREARENDDLSSWTDPQ